MSEPDNNEAASSPWPAWMPLAVAVGFAVAAIWFGVKNLSLEQENGGLRTERDVAQIAQETAALRLRERTLIAERLINDLGRQLRDRMDLAQLKIIALAPLSGNPSDARAIAVWDPVHATGLLAVEKLPVITDEQDYKIWIIDPAYPDPVNGGVFKPGADGRAQLTFRGDQPVKNATAFALSLEKKNVGPKAAGPLVLTGKL